MRHLGASSTHVVIKTLRMDESPSKCLRLRRVWSQDLGQVEVCPQLRREKKQKVTERNG